MTLPIPPGLYLNQQTQFPVGKFLKPNQRTAGFRPQPGLMEYEVRQIAESTCDMVDQIIKRVEETFKKEFCKPEIGGHNTYF